jgi:hypothetical protein
MAVLAENGMQQVPVEMFENRSALITDFERGGGLAQAALSAIHCNWIRDEMWRTSRISRGAGFSGPPFAARSSQQAR